MDPKFDILTGFSLGTLHGLSMEYQCGRYVALKSSNKRFAFNQYLWDPWNKMNINPVRLPSFPKCGYLC